MKKITSIILTIAMLAMGFASYASAFEDVGENYSWASESIEKFFAENIIQGKSEGIFAPDDPVTRAEFAKMLALTFGLEAKSENVYTDVGENEWYNEYIKMADSYTVAISVLDANYSADMYAPDMSATRQEIAASLAMVVAENTPKTSDSINTYLENNFVDYEDVNEEIYTLVTRAAMRGLIKGYEDATLRPNGNVTRAEAVVMLDRAREYIRSFDQTPSPSDEPTSAPTSTPDETPTPTIEPTIEPTAEPSPTPSPVATPRPLQDLVSVVDVVMTSINSEKFFSIYYTYGGVYIDEPLVAFEDANVFGQKSTMWDVECGDVIVYETGNKGYVTAIRVIYSPGEKYDNANSWAVSLPENLNWGFWETGKVTEIYFGRMWEIEKGTLGGYVTTLTYPGYQDQVFLLPESGARMSVYKPHASSSKKKFEPITMEVFFDRGYQYDKNIMLVKITRDIVTDVIMIDYEKSINEE